MMSAEPHDSGELPFSQDYPHGVGRGQAITAANPALWGGALRFSHSLNGTPGRSRQPPVNLLGLTVEL